MKAKRHSLFCLLLYLYLYRECAQNELETFKLDSGLTVYLWPDGNQPDVTGVVVVRAGSIDEPAEYTGLAHYLEHVLFKGTREIGALDWERRKYITRKLSNSTTNMPMLLTHLSVPTWRKNQRRIIAAAQYANTGEFSNLVEGMGERFERALLMT